jgi:excisionase family DNA binding protein
MSNEQREYLFLPEVAELTGVSLDSVRHWIRRGVLPSVRPGRRRMVNRAVLARFLAGAGAAADSTDIK